MHPDPAFLAQLDHVTFNPDSADGGYFAACPTCDVDTLLAIWADGPDWYFECAEGCTHEEIVDYLQCDTRVDKRPAIRAWLCLRLALTPDTWAGLMLGRNVNPAAIDQHELAKQRRSGLWQ